MTEFQQGKLLKLQNGNEVEIVQKIGEGGQGAVYRVKYLGKDYALKWYFPASIKDKKRFYQNLSENILKGKPANVFLWPLEITKQCEGSFGYLMELRPSVYKAFPLFLLARENLTIRNTINAALQIVDGFKKLHRIGYSYQDLNDGNFFIEPATGNVLICDNDNVAEYGDNLGIAGKSRYMAPEIVKGERRPDVWSDRFSLAVILYLLFFRNHPLEGKRTMCPCLTEDLECRFYGKEPIFVFDPTNDSNRPVLGVHTNEITLWKLFPQFVKDAFAEAFSQDNMVGADREQRIMEKSWQEIFIKLRDSLITCGCGEETFYDTTNSANTCINCGKPLRKLPILKVKKYSVVLEPKKKLYACHTVYDSDDFSVVTAEVILGKKDPKLWGLRNLSDNVWEATLPNGVSKSFAKDGVIPVAKGIKIDFGNGNVAEIL